MSYFQFYVWWCFSTWFGLLSQGRYCKAWDRELNELLDKYGKDAEADYFTVTLGDKSAWISNALYCYGHDNARCARPYSYRKYDIPSVRTMHRLYLCSEWVRDGKPDRG